MAELTAASNEDPLIAALPPATDYITYLTLLEYQLHPENLSTLNRLLSEDNGSLAEEIGWDLLRLVLPMLAEVPETASSCLELIARRGNPREVVVRIAEELEKLGRGDGDEEVEDEVDLDEKNENDGLPTFPGEAKRIHLGEMKLDGMPETVTMERSEERSLSAEEPLVDTRTTDLLYFQSLLSMLCVVHPRIKTHHPSRFLATTLPASLGAYRRLQAPNAATISYIDCLKKLSGKQKPPLPPRTSTGSVPAANNTAPLPDPEAEAPSEGPVVTSDNERAIIARLLQAVLLEVVDEYMSSLQSQDLPSMSWTSRLREQAEPRRVVPGKNTEAELWKVDNNLRDRDETVRKFVSVAKDLQVDPSAELEKLIVGDSSHPEQAEGSAEDDEPSEYPTSASQIPFAQTALLLLRAAQQFNLPPSQQELNSEAMSKIFHLVTPLSNLPNLPNPAVQDALHSQLYQMLLSSPTIPHWNQNLLINLVSTLTQAFTITPHPQLRDDAHHLATKLLHEQSDAETRIAIIKQTLRGYTTSPDPETANTQIPLSTPFAQGSSMAVGVDWLKDEMLMFLKSPSPPNDEPHIHGINPSILENDTELFGLLFPPIPPPLSTTTSEQNPSDREAQDTILLSMPFYISALNLSFVLLSNDSSHSDALLGMATNFLSSLESWRDSLVQQMSQDDDDVKQSVPDIFALEDACWRLRVILDSKASSKMVEVESKRVAE